MKEVMVCQFSKGDISPLQKMVLLTAWERGAKGRGQTHCSSHCFTVATTPCKPGAVRNAQVIVTR